MRGLARTLSVCFAAGAVGALATGFGTVWAGRLGLYHAVGVSLAPALTREFLYQRLVWGGLWGALLALPIAPGRWVQRGALIALAPAAVQLLVIFPYVAHKGFFGLELGLAVPLVVLFWNVAWGVVASGWYRFAR